MVIAPLFIPFTLNRQFPLFVARTLFSSLVMKIVGIKLKVHGVENVPTDKPVIFVANHCSHLDIIVLCRSLPVNLHFIGKKELAWIPIVGDPLIAIVGFLKVKVIPLTGMIIIGKLGRYIIVTIIYFQSIA